MKKIIIFILIELLLISGCAGTKYSAPQLKNDKNIYRELINRRVEIRKTDRQKISGFLKSVHPDSLTILHINHKDIMSERKIALNDIQSIKIKKQGNPMVVVGFTSILAIMILLGKALDFPSGS